MECICTKCGGRRSHSILKEVEKNVVEPDELWWEDYKYQIIQCDGCKDITFRRMYSDAQIAQYADGDDRWSETLYPLRTFHTRKAKNISHFPEKLRIIYLETIEAFNNKMFILCSAGLRALIEGICLDKHISGKEITRRPGKYLTTLNHKIDALKAEGILTEGNRLALHELRFLGNEALHELNVPDLNDLIIAIDIIEHTLSSIYDLHMKTRRLKLSSETRSKKEE